jgi:hypothetical protein
MKKVGKTKHNVSGTTVTDQIHRDAVLQQLREWAVLPVSQQADKHAEADMMILKLLGDREIAAAFIALRRWYE